MFVYAVVPVKALVESKRRLSAVLNPQERKLLTVAMLQDVLRALKTSVVRETVVVSNDPEVHGTAHRFGVSCLSPNRAGLNAAIEEATTWCMKNNADSVLVLPADIPLVSSRDIDTIVSLGSAGASVVLSPSQNGGTNALFKNPPNVIPASFGPKSFMRHAKKVFARGIAIRLYYSAGIGIDFDSAEDLRKLLEIENNTASRRVLEQIRLQRRKNLGSRMVKIAEGSLN